MGKILVSGMTLLILLGSVGCQSDAQTGALIGGAVGAGVGQAVGRDTEGTLIGAAVGAGAGYVIGAQSDKKKAEQQRQQEVYYPQSASAAATETVWITNSNGSKTSVTLRREGGYWYGPRGERYDTKPTEEQLRSIYGF